MIAALALTATLTVDFKPDASGFALIHGGKPAVVYVDAGADRAVKRVAEDFASDLQKVSGTAPSIVHDLNGVKGPVVIIGQVGHSDVIDGLVKAGKLKLDGVTGQWEAYEQAVVDQPAPGVAKALVIAGSDKRGAIFGAYDLSARIGVSPWYWWADVPVTPHDEVSLAGQAVDRPQVKYRGFFINDEDPAFGGWAKEKFGGVNHQAYAHVFELLLRLKGDYLWPAMWGRSIADDDPQSLDTADDYGVVLGTSHHEPMTRAQIEWHRHQDGGITGGAWDYTKNAANLRAFWTGGMERAKSHDYVVTVGMRGDGDEPMSEGTATTLLEQIVADQRKIIADVTGKPADQTPQVWALYKEVQAYYDHGMKVPDDVTLLFSDDNWGDLRRLPDLTAKPRAGGYGIYYHFDYVGGPRNYKWINTNQIEKTWQQMDLAWEAGANQLWIVNVGDIKPMEYPMSFFFDMAWNPKAMTPEAVKAYPAQWAGQQFGDAVAEDVGDILTRYSKYTARRKPELIDATSFSLDNYDEWTGLDGQFNDLVHQVSAVGKVLTPKQRDALTEVVGYEVNAQANLYDLYSDVAWNQKFAAVGQPAANTYADKAEAAFKRDGALAQAYNQLQAGKWDHMMDQTHIGYSGWQQPDVQVMPPLQRVGDGKPGRVKEHYSVVINVEGGIKPGQRFKDTGGYVSIDAQHFNRKIDGADVHWQVIPDLGRTLSSVIAYPQLAAPSDGRSMRLEYDVTLSHDADATLNLYLAPTLDTAGKGGLKLAVAIDDQAPQTLSFDLDPEAKGKGGWAQAVSDNILILKAPFAGLKAGPHTIKVFRIDGNVVLEKLVLDTGGLKPSYLGPPESLSAR